MWQKIDGELNYRTGYFIVFCVALILQNATTFTFSIEKHVCGLQSCTKTYMSTYVCSFTNRILCTLCTFYMYVQ